MKIGIIGAGWYGCHLALVLQNAGHDVTLFEKNEKIFSEISGQFGTRLHAGPHYPRSEETRKSCKRGASLFKERYPELVIPHQYSIYALGETDAEGYPSKIDAETFRKVCEETDHCNPIDPKSHGYQHLLSVMDIEEPSIALGTRLREAFIRYLNHADVQIVYNYEVKKLESSNTIITISGETSSHEFDRVINATSYKAFVPDQDELPFDMEVQYQPCLALVYEDTTPDERPISIIVTDGWFPSLMPITTENDDHEQSALSSRRYILTHGKWTIMGSYSTVAEAKTLLNSLTDDFVQHSIKPLTENEMLRFWPTFADRFQYRGWTGEVLAKLKTKREFRSAITYEKDGIIWVVPGKISNIFDVEREVLALLKGENNVIDHHGYRYVKNGVLDDSRDEIAERPNIDDRNTCDLQTYQELQQPITLAQTRPHNAFRFFQQPSHLNHPNHKKTDTLPTFSSDHYFELQCLVSLVGGLATVAVMMLILPIAGAAITAITTSAAVIGIGYAAFNLLASQLEPQKDMMAIETPSIRLRNLGA